MCWAAGIPGLSRACHRAAQADHGSRARAEVGRAHASASVPMDRSPSSAVTVAPWPRTSTAAILYLHGALGALRLGCTARELLHGASHWAAWQLQRCETHLARSRCATQAAQLMLV